MEQDYNITPSGYIYGRDPKATVPFWNVDTLKSLNEEIDNLNTEINNLELEIEQLENEKQNLQNNIDSLNIRIQELESENQTLEDNISDLNSQIQQLQTEKQNLQNNIDSLNSQIQSLNNDINNLELENQNLTNEISNFQNRFFGIEPFPEGYTLDFIMPTNWNYQYYSSILEKLAFITCDTININYLDNSLAQTGTYNIGNRIKGCNCNYLNMNYPRINTFTIYNTDSNLLSGIHKATLTTKWDFTKYLSIRIPLYVKSNYKYNLNQSIFEIKMLTSDDTPYYNIECQGNSSQSIVDYSNHCIIFNYGTQTISSADMVRLQDDISDSTGISALASSGLVFFVSDQAYSIFAADSNWSQLGVNLRKLSEFNEGDW